MYRRGGRTLHRLALLGLLLGGCILLVIAVSAAYQVVATARERARFPVPGRLIDVGGYRLHLRCAGKGRPAVILESGFGMSSNEWALVHPAVAKFTQVCSYDRTGYGWSESGPRADAIEVLHVLLRNAAIRGPYVLVGHSYGSGLIRRYRFGFRSKSLEWCSRRLHIQTRRSGRTRPRPTSRTDLCSRSMDYVRGRVCCA